MASESYTLTASVDKTRESFSEASEEKEVSSKKRGSVCEIVVLALTIATVTGLLLLPIIFYHLPVEVQKVWYYCATKVKELVPLLLRD